MLLLLPAVVLLALSALLYRRDPRGWTNAVPLVLGVLLALLGLSTPDAHGLPLSGLAGLVLLALVVMAPFAVVVLTGYLLWNGLTMVRREGRALQNLLSLLAGLGMLALLVWLVLSVFAFRSPWAFLLGLAAVVVVAYPAFVFVSYLVASLVYSRRRETPAAHDIVELGSSVSSGRVPPLLAARLDRAIRQWRDDADAGFGSVIIPSGGKGADEPLSEGDAMARYLVEQGIPADAVVVEGRARNTVENLRYSLELARADSRADGIVVVTSEFHALRAAQLCRDLAIPAHVLGGRTASYFLPSAYLREFVALMKRQWWLHALCMGVLAAAAGWMVAVAAS